MFGVSCTQLAQNIKAFAVTDRMKQFRQIPITQYGWICSYPKTGKSEDANPAATELQR